MKSVSTTLKNAIRSAYDINALPKLVADWNMNRYYPVTVTNTPSEATAGVDVEMFPIETIVAPNRPTKGINKARINESKVADNYVDPNDARFYVASVDDKYKYWQSPYISDTSGNITGVLPTVMYGSNVSVNKVVVKLETSWSTPASFSIDMSYDGTTWNTVATNPTIKNDGSIVLYWNGAGWASTKPSTLSAMKTVRGVRLSVTKLKGGTRRDGLPTLYNTQPNLSSPTLSRWATNGINTRFSLIEMGLHREVDLTQYVVSVQDTFDTSDASQLYPVGSLTSNTASVTLWNGDSLFNNVNTLSPFKGLIDANVEMNLEYIYNISGTSYTVQQFKMFTQNWAGQTNATVEVSLADASTYLGTISPLPAMYENLSLPDIIYRICDSIGFVDYKMVTNKFVTDFTIPIFWVDGTQTVWEVFDDLAKATQSAIYFDAFGIMQIKTREAAFDTTRPTDWTIRGVNSGTELADLVQDSLSQTEEYNNNVVKVSYSATAWSDWNNGVPTMQSVWEPEGSVVLRASNLYATLDGNDIVAGTNKFIQIAPNDAKIWTYDGMMNVEGELIRYKGKNFIYYTAVVTTTYNSAGNPLVSYVWTQNSAIVTTQEEYEKYNELIEEGYRYKNHFDGKLLITERGAWNSQISSHTVEANNYSVRGWVNNVHQLQASGFIFNSGKSTVTMTSNSKMNSRDDVLVATRGQVDDVGYVRYGTNIKLNGGAAYTHNQAGIVIHSQGGKEDGYFIELKPTSKFDGPTRAQRNELVFMARKNGINTLYGNNGMGTALAIVEGVEYELDVFFTQRSNGDHFFKIWVNGLLVLSVTVPAFNTLPKNGRFGMHVRGVSSATYEYIYGMSSNMPDIPDDVTYYDKIKGGYMGGLYTREWTYGWRSYTRRVKKKTISGQQRWNEQLMDEFGAIAHEVREYDVKFDPAPVLHSRLYMSNDWSTICTEYRGNPFGAKFVIANTSRDNAVINGEDTLSYAGSSSSIDQQLMVIGRALVTQDAVEIVARNETQIRARGEIETTMDSTWVQTKAAAEALSEWIKNHWGTGTEDYSVQVFGNPLIEIGDVVTIDWPSQSFLPTTRYFVVGTSSQFDTGITTTLTLRRIV